MSEHKDSKATSLQRLFLEALDYSHGAERIAFLDLHCPIGSPLREKLELLLDHAAEDTFLENPAVLRESSTPKNGDEPSAKIIGRYKLLEEIGEGGMGIVYMAEQKEPVRRKVALKVIKLGMDTKQVVARFEAERQALALMEHPHIAKVLDGGSTENGRPYFVMELVKGIPIHEFCDTNRLTIQQRLELFLRVCQAIQHAHQKGIIHRDIKPSNVLVTIKEGEAHPIVIDFGIAKATNEQLTEKTLFTRYSQWIGTPVYMSPEQTQMSKDDVDTRVDVYSLGILLYELLTGAPPFSKERFSTSDFEEIQKIIQHEEPTRPSTSLGALGDKLKSAAMDRGMEPVYFKKCLLGDLDWIILKAIEKDRNRRYDSVSDFATDIRRHLNDEPVSASPPTALYRLHKEWKRNKVMYITASLIFVSLLIGISVSLWQARVAMIAKKEAVSATQRESDLRTAAETKELEQRLTAYASDMSLAHGYMQEHDFDMARKLLDRYVTETEEEDIRGIFWHHINGNLQPQLAKTIPHEAMVRSVSLSEDGSRLASQTISGRVRLYDTHQHQVMREYGGGVLSYGAREGSVSISPNGRYLASDQQGTLKVWDTYSEELIFEKVGVTAPICFSPDSRLLVGLAEKGIQLIDASTWSQISLIGNHSDFDTSKASALTFTPEGQHLLLAPQSFGAKILIYHLDDQEVVKGLTGLEHPSVLACDHQHVVAGGKDGFVGVWNRGTGEFKGKFKAHNSIVLGVALAPDGKNIVTGGNDSVVLVWDINTFSQRGFLEGHQSQVWNLTFDRQGQFLASASMDQSVKIWPWNQVNLDGGLLVKDEIDKRLKIAYSKDTRSHESLNLKSREINLKDTQIHIVQPGENIQAVIDAAVPGDRIELASGEHQINETLKITKPLSLVGKREKSGEGKLLSRVLGGVGKRFVLQIDTHSTTPTNLQDLQIEGLADGVQHQSGDFRIISSELVIRSQLDFTSVISLEGTSTDDVSPYKVLAKNSLFHAKYSGDTPEGTPPDIDIILASSGAVYSSIEIIENKIVNEIPNFISNGIETRSTTGRILVQGCSIQTLGMAVVLPDHVGKIEVITNRIHSASVGITTGGISRERSLISGNEITVKKRDIQVFPLFLQDYINRKKTCNIAVGHVSTGVTAGFFRKNPINSCSNMLIEANRLKGDPHYGISIRDSNEPENYGQTTLNLSHDITIEGNHFTELNAHRDLALGASTRNNMVRNNYGLESIYRAAGENDNNTIFWPTNLVQ